MEEIKLAFSDVLNSGKDGHNPLFLSASILDPTVAYLVLEKKPEAVRAIREMVLNILIKFFVKFSKLR